MLQQKVTPRKSRMFNMGRPNNTMLRRHLQTAGVEELAAVEGAAATDVVQPLGQLAHQRDRSSRRGSAPRERASIF